MILAIDPDLAEDVPVPFLCENQVAIVGHGRHLLVRNSQNCFVLTSRHDYDERATRLHHQRVVAGRIVHLANVEIERHIGSDKLFSL